MSDGVDQGISAVVTALHPLTESGLHDSAATTLHGGRTTTRQTKKPDRM